MRQTIEQIIEAETQQRLAWEANTEHKGFTIAALREVFDRIRPTEHGHWKDPFVAKVLPVDLEAFKVAVEFFLADDLIVHGLLQVGQNVGKYLVESNGYQAW